jgi:aminocarboxymuconate-semialdehyde decarboxylase
MQAIDMHAHYWPRGLLAAVRGGREWYGWRPTTTAAGKPALELMGETLPFTAPEQDLEDPEARQKIRWETQGVDFEALMVVGFLWNYHLDPEQGAAYCREVNEELAELERSHPDHYRGLALLPMQDHAAAMQELAYATDVLGLRSFAMSSHVNGLNLDDPAIMPTIDALADADVSINVHPPYFDKIGDGDRFQRHYFKSTFGAPIESSIALLSLAYGGLYDRHPDLRIWFTHGCGVANFTMGRFESHWNRFPADQKPMQTPPSACLKRSHGDCLVHDDDSLRFLIERLGISQVTLGTDYPFVWDHPGGAANWVRDADFLSQEEKDAILWKNAARFLRLPGADPV